MKDEVLIEPTGVFEIQIFFSEHKHNFPNDARRYLAGPFLTHIKQFLQKQGDLNFIDMNNYYIIYHVPIYEKLKPKSKGVICSFFYSMMYNPKEFFNYVKNELDKKIVHTDWMAFYELQLRR